MDTLIHGKTRCIICDDEVSYIGCYTQKQRNFVIARHISRHFKLLVKNLNGVLVLDYKDKNRYIGFTSIVYIIPQLVCLNIVNIDRFWDNLTDIFKSNNLHAYFETLGRIVSENKRCKGCRDEVVKLFANESYKCGFKECEQPYDYGLPSAEIVAGHILKCHISM